MLVWILFLSAVVFFLALDLGVFNRKPHIISLKEATVWTVIWVVLSFLFSGVVFWLYANAYLANPTQLKPHLAAVKFITGYLIELSLSVDNIFVIAIIFSSFKIAQKYQHRILFWGILGAIVFRGSMIYFGVILINNFSWMTYLFGAFLLFTAMRMLLKKETDKPFDPRRSIGYRVLGKIIPITTHHEKADFFIRRNAKLYATPLFVALVVIEVMDVLFALDSVPAILAITADPFIVFSSNIFAILGLRSMYFFLANMLEKFGYLEYSLVAILVFVGAKMLAHEWIDLPEWASLGFIAVSLIVGILVSVAKAKDDPAGALPHRH